MPKSLEFTKDQYLTRESSTLTIATITASLSLTIYAMVLSSTQMTLGTAQYTGLVALTLSFFGITYREITIFTTDIEDLKKIYQGGYEVPSFSLPRSFMLRMFFFIPVSLWLSLLMSIKLNLAALPAELKGLCLYVYYVCFIGVAILFSIGLARREKSINEKLRSQGTQLSERG